MTAVALNSVPPRPAGMAGATTDMPRDLGFTLGPVVVGAVALSGAAAAVAAALTAFGMIGLRARHSSADETSGVLPSAPDDRTPDPAVAR
ncbi:hypothetical protein [Streptomyces sp. NPDC018972]|uniref:hypothetical protein n=1 Tax=Streptomyces sp. NPDC018972 TaxID=3365060 RepID=UPI0037B76FBA